jgi:hypothetical protein
MHAGSESAPLSAHEILATRQRLKGMGIDPASMSDDDIQKLALDRARSFLENAPTTAAAAAKIILDGVKAGNWRILVGDDAHRLDERVREAPEQAYEPEFYASFAKEVGWRLG